MSSSLADPAAESGMQEVAVVSGAGSPANAPLPKLPSWSATGWQTLLKQPSAGTANLTDLLADPGQTGEGTQAGGDAGASPLFKWTSDGSMMEELMKAYKDSSPGTPTFGGGAQGNSLFRDGSLLRDGWLYKDGSITSCLQAAFQAQLEEEDQNGHQAGGLASVAESSDQTAAVPSTTPEQSPRDPQPFAFTSVGADTKDSPQLNVPPANLGSYQASQSSGHRSEPQAAVAQAEYTQPGLTQTQVHPQQPEYTQTSLTRPLSHPQQQGQHQPLQQLAGDGQASSAIAQQMPSWQQQPQAQYNFAGQLTGQRSGQLPGQLPGELPEQPTGRSHQQKSQQQQHLTSMPVTVNPTEYQPSYRYPQLPAASQLTPPQGNQAMYPNVSNAVITSGAMGPSMWSSSLSRSSSPALQPQGGPAPSQPPQLLQNADGSMQAVPRIVIRTSPAGEPAKPSPPGHHHPVVLNSRVVRESTPAAQEPYSAGPSPLNHTHWTGTQQQPLQQHHQPQHLPQYGMHQYQQQASVNPQQQPQLQAQAYQQQPTPQADAASPQQQSQQLHYSSQQPRQQLPQQQHQQVQQPPRPGSFQELLSAPVLPELYNNGPVAHDLATQPPPTRAQTPQSTAIYSGQVVHRPVASSGSALDIRQLPCSFGSGPILSSGHVVPQKTGSAQQQQSQQQQGQFAAAQPYTLSQPASCSQHRIHTSSAMYPPIQYPQSAGAYPVLPKTATGPLPGHPYHGLQANQSARADTGPLQAPQQQAPSPSQQAAPPPQQLHPHGQQHHPQQLYHTYPQVQSGHPNQVSMQGHVSHQPGRASNVGNALDSHQGHVGSGEFLTPHMAPVQIGGVIYEPPQLLQQHASREVPGSSASSHPAGPKGMHPTQDSFLMASQQASSGHQQASVQTHRGQLSHSFAVGSTQGMYQSPQPQAMAQTGGCMGSGGAHWGSEQGVNSGPAFTPAHPVGESMGKAGYSPGQQQPSGASSQQATSSVISTASQSLPGSHGTVVLTSHPVASSEGKATGKVVSFAAESQQGDDTVMPSIPSLAKENVQDQGAQHGLPPQPGRKFKRDRSSRKNSFSLPPVPPKKQASAAIEFSPASSLEFALQGAASAPTPAEEAFPAALAALGMPHSASCQDMATGFETSAGAVAASSTGSGGKSSRSSSTDVIFCADGIDFNSRAWKNMTRKEKNRASAAASRARREAYTESLEDKVRKLQEERDWLQEQIEPGSVDKEADEPMQVPTRPPVRHLSL